MGGDGCGLLEGFVASAPAVGAGRGEGSGVRVPAVVVVAVGSLGEGQLFASIGGQMAASSIGHSANPEPDR